VLLSTPGKVCFCRFHFDLKWGHSPGFGPPIYGAVGWQWRVTPVSLTLTPPPSDERHGGLSCEVFFFQKHKTLADFSPEVWKVFDSVFFDERFLNLFDWL
jgi:hypothetical protein